MKKLKALLCLTILTLGMFLSAANAADTNKDMDLPARVEGSMVSQDVREGANRLATPALRVAYLSSVIASNALKTNEIQNFRKASALRLLGVIKSTNSIPVLVSNITFVDAEFPRRPAYSALEKIGEPAVPYLMDVVEDPSAPADKLELVVQVLRFIKHANQNSRQWDRFVEEQKKVLPPELWGRVDRKIWEID